MYMLNYTAWLYSLHDIVIHSHYFRLYICRPKIVPIYNITVQMVLILTYINTIRMITKLYNSTRS